MDKHEETTTWLKFFKDAGIPKETGASYAHIFVENRINKDMLSELTVDYLRLMGITLMGDIIAILRHCKSVYQDSVRKVIILQSKDEKQKVVSLNTSSSSSSSSGSSSDSSSDDDVEMVEVTKNSTKKVPASTKNSDHSNRRETMQKTEKNEVKQIKSQVVGKIVSRLPTPVSEKRTVLPAKRKYEDEKRKYDDGKKKYEDVKRNYDDDNDNLSQDEPTSRAKISSNSGKSVLKSSTPETKKIRVMTESDIIGPKLPPPKKTVFERLGAETEPPQVSSTTEVPIPAIPEVETKFTRTISSVSLPLKSANITPDEDIVASSVFNRLGGMKDDAQVQLRTSLPYAGVLKSPPTIKRSPQLLKKPARATNSIKLVRGTMRADEPEVPVKLRASTTTNTSDAKKLTIQVGQTSVRSRLKPYQPTKATLLRRKKDLNVGSQGIFANETLPTSVNIKHRLGLTHSSGEVSSTSSIKKRLSRPPPHIVKEPTSVYDDDDDFERFAFGSRTDLKRVSFGKVERKSISPVGSLRSPGYARSNGRGRIGIHSRLGRTSI